MRAKVRSISWSLPRSVAAAMAMVAVCVLSFATPASASPAHKSKGYPISVIVVGKWVHHKHKLGSAIRELSATPEHCEPWFGTEIVESRYVFVWDGKNLAQRDGPGPLTMKTGEATGSRVSATISGNAYVTVTDLVTTTHVQVSASVTKSDYTKVANGITFNVGSNQWGNAEFGAYAYQVKWQYWRVNGNCSGTELAHGGGTVPVKTVGWYKWCTNSGKKIENCPGQK